MSKKDSLTELITSVWQGDRSGAKQFAEEALNQGVSPKKLLEDGLVHAMNIVGDKWKSMEIFLPEVLMAVDAWQEAMDVVEPRLTEEEKTESVQGKVVIGTVKGDIHEIGKNIVATLLTTAGFEVIDIGTDVPASVFVSEADKSGAKIIAASALMTTTMPNQRDIIEYLESNGIRDKYFIMVGGAPVNQEWMEEIGADGYGKTADDAVQIARKASG
jgi:trimethylamine corrinoid protein